MGAKIDFRARRRKKQGKTAAGSHCFGSGLDFGRFLGPTWVPEWRLWGDFRPTFATFWAPVGSHVVFLCSRVLGEGVGIDLGSPGEPPGRYFGTIFGHSLRCSGHWWRPDSALSLSKFCPKFDQLVALLLLPPPTRPAHQLKGRRSPRSGLNLKTVLVIIISKVRKQL